MPFIAYVAAEAGCDYSIACGVKVIKLDAASLADAQVAVEAYLKDDEVIKRVMIYEVAACVEFDMGAFRAATAARRRAEADAANEVRERQEYERLSKKFGV